MGKNDSKEIKKGEEVVGGSERSRGGNKGKKWKICEVREKNRKMWREKGILGGRGRGRERDGEREGASERDEKEKDIYIYIYIYI